MTSSELALVVGTSILLLGLLVWRAARIFYPKRSMLDNPALFFGLVFLALLILRWERITYPGELNPDESQMLAQGMRFVSHPVPWRDVDGTTSGPLNSLLLTAPLWCGAPATWATDRLVLLAANCAIVLFSYLSLRCFLGRAESQFALIPLVLFYGFTLSSDFMHYSSETLPSALISACLYLLARQWVTTKASRPAMFLLGVLLGAIPFAKMQAVPLGMFLGVAGLSLIYAKRQQPGNPPRKWLVESGVLVLGALLVPAVILGVVAGAGAFDDFWKSYIVASRKYAEAEHVLSSGKLAGLPPLLRRFVYTGYVLLFPANLGIFFASGIGAMIVLAGIYRRGKFRFPSEVRIPLATILVYGFATILCFFAAGKPFAHYGNLMIPLLALFIGLVFLTGKYAFGWGGQTPATGSGARWLVAFTILAMGLQGAYLGSIKIYRCIAYRNAPPFRWTPAWSGVVRLMSRPGDELSVWGWMAEAYVRTGLPPATRDAIGHYVISDGPLQEYYRKRYLDDLERSKPAIFIDALGDGTMLWDKWTPAQKHECFPELAKYIDDNYALVANYQMRPKVQAGSIRIYVLKRRLAELHLPSINSGAPPINDYPPGEKVEPPASGEAK